MVVGLFWAADVQNFLLELTNRNRKRGPHGDGGTMGM